MKNGFTLVELLGVIIILSLIIAIISPVVLKTVNNSTSAINKYSSEKYIDAVEQAVLEKNLNEKFKPSECTINTDGSLTCDGNILEINADGKKPDGGKISFESRDVTTAILKYDDKTIVRHNNGEFTLVEEPKSFTEDSWDTISANVIVGNLSAYNVGDTKEIALTGFTNKETGSDGLYTIRIANTTNEGEVCTKEYLEREDGTKEKYSKTACGFVIEFVDIITKRMMNSPTTNKGGYPASAMYTYIQNDIYNALPEELREKIIETTVVSGYGKGDAPNKESIDKLYLLSGKEIHGLDTHDTSADLTRQLDYYKSIGVTTSSHSGIIKKFNGDSNSWWSRSADPSTPIWFYLVHDFGRFSPNNCGNCIYGVSVAFRIG